MSNSSDLLAHWEPSDWVEASQCPPSVGGVTFLILAYSAVIAVGLLGNAGLVFIVARQQELRNVTNVLIANLSCSDILMCVVCVPVTAAYTLMDRWVLGEALCKAAPFLQCVCVSVSVFSLVLIALERHQLIVHPTGWQPAVTHSVLAVALTWLLAAFISLPFVSVHVLTDDPFHNATHLFRGHLVCMELWPSVPHRLSYTTSLLLLQYLLPLLLVLLCYLKIFLRLRRRRDVLERSRRTRGAHRINVMLLAIVVAFALCWLPLNVFNALFDWHHQALPACLHDAVFSACHLAAMASTCINPLVYGFLNSNFQRELRATLRHCRCRHAGHAGHAGHAHTYQSFLLSTVGSDGVTKATVLHRTGSVCVASPRPLSATKTLPSST